MSGTYLTDLRAMLLEAASTDDPRVRMLALAVLAMQAEGVRRREAGR